MNFTNIETTKQWIAENNVLFVTNSLMRPGGTFLSSLLCYVDRIPIHNMAIIPGTKQRIRDKNNIMEMPCYGIDVFDEITRRSFQDIVWKQFDYVVYIDDDCFVTDFPALMQMLSAFMTSNCCIAGPQDGGVFCHRNHSHVMVNTFICFWNTKLLRETTTFNSVTDYINIISNHPHPFTKFRTLMKNMGIWKDIEYNALETIERMKDWRKDNWTSDTNKDAWSPYAKVVTNDTDNPVEPHQIPYSYRDDGINYEPYYLIEQAWVLATRRPVMFFNATDLYSPDEDDDTTDNSGLTSAVMDDNMNVVAVHTWYSRMYSKFPINEKMLKNTIRINKVIAKYAVT